MKNKTVNKISLSVLGAVMALGLTACAEKQAPDEFLVMKNPPLVLPPDYHLVPPGDDALADAYTPSEIAKRALFGKVN